MAAENNLGKDKVSRLVWRIAIPSMLGQFVSVVQHKGLLNSFFLR